MRDDRASEASIETACARIHLNLAGAVHREIERNGKPSRGLVQLEGCPVVDRHLPGSGCAERR